ncbi:MAG: zinc dependent phospholipase C family protein [Candidatus Lokiarchaeota archaeon]|nr:zinc dependent phospholipase C family protein [Candidatus Harpocratesius repetitus]
MNLSAQIGTFILIILISLSILSVPAVFAWKNGSYAYNPSDYDYSTDYGTHDWIADAALDYLLEINSSHWNWLNERREIFYVGTEAPDNSGVSMQIDGKNITGFGDTALHHIYFYENGSILANEDDSAIRAKWCGDWADVSMSEGNWDSAAFYLGAMTHYLADMSMYAHVAPNNVAPFYLNFDEHHSRVEGYVNTRTNEVDDVEEFFQLNINITQLLPESPYNAAVELAWDTYTDPNPTLAFHRGSVWLHENFFSGWALTIEQREEESNSTKIAYYERIEENLNNAVAACIKSILAVGENYTYFEQNTSTSITSSTTSSTTNTDSTSNPINSDDSDTESGNKGIFNFISLPGGFFVVLLFWGGIIVILLKKNYIDGR